jgi:FG-GAP-like repeat
MRNSTPSARRYLWPIVALFCVGLVAFDWQHAVSTAGTAPQAQSSFSADDKLVRATCTGCHAFPPPDILPRDRWRDEIVRMMFIREKRTPPTGPPDTVYRTVQLPADMAEALAFYEARAPERLPAPTAWPDPAESPVRFERRGLAMADMPDTPAVSNVSLVDFDGDKRLDLLGTDMRQGVVFIGRPTPGGSLSVVASIPYPSRATLTDLDRDGVNDLLVGDMGAFFPADHRKGAVIWLRGLGKGKFSASLWLDDWPRVAAVEGADFNGDGRIDLAIAAFGWRTTGHVTIAENRTTTAAQPSFTTHAIDPRPGAIHMIPTDLNGDGKMDFVVLLAQEHETVLAYINKGTGDFSFDQKMIYAAPHPNWGSSGIQLVDLDKDDDLDVLLTHGDTFDDGIVKPYHGIQWLENKGSYPFAERTLAQMPGVHRAHAADMDGDGDLDVVACALLAGGADVDEKTLPAVVWLEQTTSGAYVRHTIEMGSPRHATLDVGDIDGDGDLDIVVGNFWINGPRSPAWVDVWTNQGKRR